MDIFSLEVDVEEVALWTENWFIQEQKRSFIKKIRPNEHSGRSHVLSMFVLFSSHMDSQLINQQEMLTWVVSIKLSKCLSPELDEMRDLKYQHTATTERSVLITYAKQVRNYAVSSATEESIRRA